MFVLEICIGPVQSIFCSYKPCINVGVRVRGVVARLHHPWLVRSATSFVYMQECSGGFPLDHLQLRLTLKIDHWK